METCGSLRNGVLTSCNLIVSRDKEITVFFMLFFQFFFSGYHRYRCNYAETTNHSSEVRTCNCQSGKVKLWYTSLPRIADCFPFWQKMQNCGSYLWSILYFIYSLLFFQSLVCWWREHRRVMDIVPSVSNSHKTQNCILLLIFISCFFFSRGNKV